MTKKIYRTWQDELPLWLVYGALAATAGALLLFIAPQVLRFLRGLSWKIFASEDYRYLRWIFQGLSMTLRLSAVSMVFALILGTLVGVGRLSPSRFVRSICTPYVEFFRNTPLLIQLFFWYFGTSSLLDALASGASWLPGAGAFLQGWILSLKEAYNKGQSEFISGVVGLTVYTSAFIAETVRAGIQAIPHGQTEAAKASGLNGMQTLRLVILPQAFRIIIPPLLSQFLALTKNSSQAMAIGVAEVTYMARQVEANTFKGFEAFTVATGLYMVISFLMSYLLNRYDQSISIAEMARRRQKLMAMRGVTMGYGLSWVFVVFSAGGALLAWWEGGRLASAGSWFSALAFLAAGATLAAAAPVARRRPAWGVGFIKGGLALVSTVAFFALLGRLDEGLVSFEDPVRQLLLPLGWGVLGASAVAFWWVYFHRRAALFLGGNER